MSDCRKEATISQTINGVIDRLCEEIRQKVFGHEETARLIAGAFLIGGHVLLEGPPGIGKTLMAKTFADSLGLKFKRIQFTPDLMPSDVTGVYVFDQKSSTFRFSPGPLFADILLADEINRTPPKTQSALLEAMEERFITIDGKSHFLSSFFFVIATQNPVEHEGTFPLPEAQLDRFLFKLQMSYPEEAYEENMIAHISSTVPQYFRAESSESAALAPVNNVVSQVELHRAQELLRQVSLSPMITSYVLKIVKATREDPSVALGASSRAAFNLALAGKLSAVIDGRDYVIPDDVQGMAEDVLAHRVIFNPEMFDLSEEPRKFIGEVVSRIPVPGESPQ